MVESVTGKAKSGIWGLDDILAGGFTREHMFLIEGAPGTGKTTIALQFLMEGARDGEKCLYITLSETERELRHGAASHGWKLDERIEIFELLPPESLLDSEQQQSLLYSSDLELGETTKQIFAAVDRAQPSRVILDSLSEIRLLAQSSLRYRRQILAIKHFFSNFGATVLLLDDMSSDLGDKTIHSVAHGVLRLEELAPSYGAERRRTRVIKYRGVKFRGGFHDVTIATGGLNVFPRLVASEHRTNYTRRTLSSGIAELDKLLGNGIESGSSTLILGPAGTGKSLLAIVFVAAAVARGEKAAFFVFDEELGLLYDRMKGLGIDLEAMQRSGNLFVEQVDAAELSPGEFAHRVRRLVDENGVKTVLIDSLNGYQAAMPEENSLILHIHELLQYLNRQGAATFMTVAQHGLVGDMKAPVDVTYLADTVILLRYFEALGSVRRALSIIKKRTGAHESTIREYRINNRGLTVGGGACWLPGRSARRSGLRWRGQAAVGRPTAVTAGPSSERAVILAPKGRDAAVAAALIREAGYHAQACGDLPALLSEIDSGAGLAVIADEAIKTADLRSLVNWLNDQPPWSDFPIVLLTHQGGGPERNPDAARIGQALGNVTFIERPFHPTTLVSIVGSAVRGRRRQYEARAILADLTESGDLLQTALTAGQLGAWELHLPELRFEASATCKTAFGRNVEGPFTYQDLEDAVHPDDRARRDESVVRTVEQGHDYNIEFRNIWPDGSLHWVDVRGRPVVRPDGSIKSLVGVCSDITARKTAEIERENLLAQLAAERTALAELTATLEQRVEQRTADLIKEVTAREKAQEQLRQAQKMETIGQLTGGVAHDFNNLLMAVMGNLDLLRKRLPDDPRLHRLVEGAIQGAERGASLTQRLLAFARQQDLHAVSVDLRALIEGMVDLLERSLGPRVELRLDIPQGLPPARIDANQLELAILNLAINARDAMPDGGRIYIAVAEYQTKGDAVLLPGRYLKLSVADTGSGMSPEILKRAIEPFFSTKQVGKGTGLGLSMVHGLAVQLGGTLQLTSTVGKGTCATLVLPIAAAAPEIENAAPPVERIKRKAVILFVDDDPLIAMSTTEMLEDLGHRVIGANSGQHALDILKSEQPLDLMVTDHMMPGMTGLELAAASRKVRPSLPVLLATGYAELPEGAQLDLPRLAKPYHQDQLRDQLDQLLA